MKVLSVKDWEDNFENSATRKLKSLQWVPISNDLSSSGLIDILDDEKNGAEVVGIWLLLVEFASKCHRRGTFLDKNGKPYSVDKIAKIIRTPLKKVQAALKRLSEIGWIEFKEHDDSADALGEFPNEPGENADMLGENADALGPRARAEWNGKNGMEWNGKNGMEGNGKNGMEGNGKEISPPAPSRGKAQNQKFNPSVNTPNIGDVVKVAESFGLSFSDTEAQEFLDWHVTRGWQVNGSKILDWRPRVRTWKERGRDMKKAPEKPERRRMSL